MNIHKTLAIVGATGAVGSTLLKLLAEKNFPAERLILIASQNSAGKKITYLKTELTVQAIETVNFAEINLAFFAAGSETARVYAPKAIAAGCWVVDKSSGFRLNETTPLIVPSVNFASLDLSKPQVVAVPNCSTIPLTMVLQPLLKCYGLNRIDVATYQAVSGAGNAGVRELTAQIHAYAANQACAPEKFAYPILNNVIACIDDLEASGYTKEEMKLQNESRKILNAPHLIVNATAVRVPVMMGHAEAVSIETTLPVDLNAAIELLKSAEHVRVLTLPEIPNPVMHAEEGGIVWVGRVRQLPGDAPNRLNLWLLANNLERGAALSALEIAEKILE
jgi:aspartate-semialdehyde dehydrogenase